MVRTCSVGFLALATLVVLGGCRGSGCCSNVCPTPPPCTPQSGPGILTDPPPDFERIRLSSSAGMPVRVVATGNGMDFDTGFVPSTNVEMTIESDRFGRTEIQDVRTLQVTCYRRPSIGPDVCVGRATVQIPSSQPSECGIVEIVVNIALYSMTAHGRYGVDYSPLQDTSSVTSNSCQ